MQLSVKLNEYLEYGVQKSMRSVQYCSVCEIKEFVVELPLTFHAKDYFLRNFAGR